MGDSRPALFRSPLTQTRRAAWRRRQRQRRNRQRRSRPRRLRSGKLRRRSKLTAASTQRRRLGHDCVADADNVEERPAPPRCKRRRRLKPTEGVGEIGGSHFTRSGGRVRPTKLPGVCAFAVRRSHRCTSICERRAQQVGLSREEQVWTGSCLAVDGIDFCHSAAILDCLADALKKSQVPPGTAIADGNHHIQRRTRTGVSPRTWGQRPLSRS